MVNFRGEHRQTGFDRSRASPAVGRSDRIVVEMWMCRSRLETNHWFELSICGVGWRGVGWSGAGNGVSVLCEDVQISWTCLSVGGAQLLYLLSI